MSDPTPEATTDQSVFEGMFARVLKPSGEFEEELRRAGYDLQKPLPRYPTRIWVECLGIAHRYCYPALTRQEGLRQLGHQFVDGFYDTIVGRMIKVLLPLLGPKGTLKRLPRMYSMARTGVRVSLVEEGPTTMRVDFEDAFGEAWFTMGLIETSSAYTGSRSTVEVLAESGEGYSLRVSWSPR